MAIFRCNEPLSRTPNRPIGQFQPETPFFLAPLAGISDSPFRRICRGLGAALVYSEMVSAKGLYYNGERTKQLLDYDPSEQPIAFQLFGSDPETIALAVRQVASAGHVLTDLNMGCPVPKVVQNGDGAALMKNPRLAAAVVRSAVAAEIETAEATGQPPRPVTVKCRSGWDSRPYDLVGFARQMEDAGAAAIAVHGRTREQFYGGQADWEAIARVRAAVTIPVIGSGDVLSPEQACQMMTRTGCDYVLIARGALGNPWIFQSTTALYKDGQLPPEPTADDKRAVVLRQLDWAIETNGEPRAVLEMRKHISWYLKGIPGAAGAREKINRAASADELREILAKILK